MTVFWKDEQCCKLRGSRLHSWMKSSLVSCPQAPSAPQILHRTGWNCVSVNKCLCYLHLEECLESLWMRYCVLNDALAHRDAWCKHGKCTNSWRNRLDWKLWNAIQGVWHRNQNVYSEDQKTEQHSTWDGLAEKPPRANTVIAGFPHHCQRSTEQQNHHTGWWLVTGHGYPLLPEQI